MGGGASEGVEARQEQSPDGGQGVGQIGIEWGESDGRLGPYLVPNQPIWYHPLSGTHPFYLEPTPHLVYHLSSGNPSPLWYPMVSSNFWYPSLYLEPHPLSGTHPPSGNPSPPIWYPIYLSGTPSQVGVSLH